MNKTIIKHKYNIGDIVGHNSKIGEITEIVVYIKKGLLPDGKGIVFEAKTTKNKTNFPLNNIQEYQYKLADELLEYVQSVFYIIEFRELNEIYLVHSSKIKEFINNNERKSIPIDWFRDKTNATLMQDLDILKYLK